MCIFLSSSKTGLFFVPTLFFLFFLLLIALKWASTVPSLSYLMWQSSSRSFEFASTSVRNFRRRRYR